MSRLSCKVENTLRLMNVWDDSYKDFSHEKIAAFTVSEIRSQGYEWGPAAFNELRNWLKDRGVVSPSVENYFNQINTLEKKKIDRALALLKRAGYTVLGPMN